MIAAQDRKVTTGIGVAALLDIFNPSAVHSHRDVVFFFASDCACVTTNAAVLINDEAVAHSKPFESEMSSIHQRILRVVTRAGNSVNRYFRIEVKIYGHRLIKACQRSALDFMRRANLPPIKNPVTQRTLTKVTIAPILNESGS